MNNPRLVQVKDELGYLHGWEQSDVERKNCSHCEAIYEYLKRENENAEN